MAPSGTGGVLNFADVLLYGDFEDAVTFDSLVETYVVALSTDPETAVCLYDTEEYHKFVKF